MKATPSLAAQRTRADGFTLTDLLAIIIIIGVLGALLLPALASTKPNSQAFQCVENQRQLARAWQMYAQDNNGRLAPNGDEGEEPSSPSDPLLQTTKVQWCPGRMDFGAPTTDPTNTLWIQAGCIYSYVKTVAVYRCPADNSSVLIYGQVRPRVRSISMNCWLAPVNNDIWDGAPNSGLIMHKESDLSVMGPVNVWLFMDENPYSINDGYMSVAAPPVPPAAPNLTWYDYPATYHNDGAGISFCDGHAQIRKWTDPAVLNMRIPSPNTPSLAASGGDLPWLQSVTTRGR